MKWVDYKSCAQLLSRCGIHRALSEGKFIHAFLVQTEHDNSTFLGNVLAQMYGNCGSLLEAEMVFERILHKNTISWNIMFGICIRSGSIHYARTLFDGMPERNVVTWNIMISSCLDSGNLEDAVNMFLTMPERSVFSWNIMISGYTLHGQGRKASQLFHQMQMTGMLGDKVTFNSVLDASASYSCIVEGKLMHALILVNSVPVDSKALINMYGKCGSLQDACRTLNEISDQDVFSWSAMISAYVDYGLVNEVFKAFQQMMLAGILPNNVTFITMLDACANEAALPEGKWMHAAFMCTFFESEIVLQNTLINMYGKCGSSRDAYKVFYTMPLRDIVSWSSMIAACSLCGNGKMALLFFRMMPREDIGPNKVTFVSTLHACTSLGYIKYIHACILRSGFESDIVIGNTLITLYSKFESLGDSWRTFEGMLDLDIVSWNAISLACSDNGHRKKSFHLFQEMKGNNMLPDMVTFVSILDSLDDLARGKQVHSCLGKEFISDVITENALVSMYANCGALEDAEKMFQRLLSPNVVSWNARIAAYIQHRHESIAIQLFQEMEVEGIRPDRMSFLTIFSAFSNKAVLAEGKRVHCKFVDKRFRQVIAVENTIIDMYSKCGSIEDARRTFEKMMSKDVVSWNVIIATYSQHGNGKEALMLFQQMQLQGVVPLSATYLSVFSVCRYIGMIDDGCHIFVSMDQDHKIVPTDHYNSIIDLLGRAGQLGESEDLVNHIPCGNTVPGWMSLYNACRMHDAIS